MLAHEGASRDDPVFPEIRGEYLGLEPPGDTPELFARGIVSSVNDELGNITFSPDLDTAYWSSSFMLADTGYSVDALFRMNVRGGRWTRPEPATFVRSPISMKLLSGRSTNGSKPL